MDNKIIIILIIIFILLCIVFIISCYFKKNIENLVTGSGSTGSGSADLQKIRFNINNKNQTIDICNNKIDISFNYLITTNDNTVHVADTLRLDNLRMVSNNLRNNTNIFNNKYHINMSYNLGTMPNTALYGSSASLLRLITTKNNFIDFTIKQNKELIINFSKGYNTENNISDLSQNKNIVSDVNIDVLEDNSFNTLITNIDLTKSGNTENTENTSGNVTIATTPITEKSDPELKETMSVQMIDIYQANDNEIRIVINKTCYDIKFITNIFELAYIVINDFKLTFDKIKNNQYINQNTKNNYIISKNNLHLVNLIINNDVVNKSTCTNSSNIKIDNSELYVIPAVNPTPVDPTPVVPIPVDPTPVVPNPITDKYTCTDSGCKIDNKNGKYGSKQDCEKKCKSKPDISKHTLTRCSPVVNVSYHTNNYENSHIGKRNRVNPFNYNDNNKTIDYESTKTIDKSVYKFQNSRKNTINDTNNKSVNSILSDKSTYCPIIMGNSRGYGEFASREN